MKYDICSDLHIEHTGEPDWKSVKNVDSTILVIAGDISNDYIQTMDVIRNASKYYDDVIWTDGNHDHWVYNGDVETLSSYYLSESRKINNVTYLNGKNYQIFGDVAFIGCNGWYDWMLFNHKQKITDCRETWEVLINDKKFIDFGQYDNPMTLAISQSMDLSSIVNSLTIDPMISKIVMTTHSAPNSLLISETMDAGYDRMCASFCNTSMKSVFTADINNKIKFVNYGHTHSRSMRMVENCMYINNAKGYGREVGSEWFMVQIDTDESEMY